MLDCNLYMDAIVPRLRETFADRLSYVGLQGSYLRGEANENSDIDIMVVIDCMTVEDMDAYHDIIESLGDAEKSCGFICSREDLAHWNPLEVFHVLNSTKDYFGTLKDLIPAYTREDIVNFVKFSLNNLYHEICHRYIHAGRERSAEALPFVYKGTFFILQNLHYLRSGVFIPTKAQLLPLLEGRDRQVLEYAMQLKHAETYDFDAAYECLFRWCQETLASL